MDDDQTRPRLVSAAELPPPLLTDVGARALLRIILKAHERAQATDSGRSVTDDQAVA